MQIIRAVQGISLRRWLTHLAMFAASVLSVMLIKTFYMPKGDPVYIFTLAFGYLALVLIALTLVIGPLQMAVFQRRRNPVNLYLRRDIGIWAGGIGLLHVFFGLQVHTRFGLLSYFFYPNTLTLRLDLFGFNNHFGLAATIALALLLASSNDYALRKLKGRRWKQLQRLNYPLAVLVILHTLGYQNTSRREQPFVTATVLLLLAVLAVQTVGLSLHRARNAQITRRMSKTAG